MHEFNLMVSIETPKRPLKAIEVRMSDGGATAELNKNHVLRTLGKDSLDGIQRNEEMLLNTGAKLYIHKNGTGHISGYAADGSDVRTIAEGIEQGKSGFLDKN